MISLQVIIALCIIILSIVHYFFKQRRFSTNPPSHLISDENEAKNILKSSDLASRARSNQNLYFTFGISNPFTNSNASYHNEFCRVVKNTIKLKDEDWNQIKNIAFEAINNYTNYEKDGKDGIIEIVPWIQKITLNVVLRGYLGMEEDIDEVINVAPGIINDLWLKSKEPATKKKNEKLMENKYILKNLFRNVISGTSRTLNVIQEISKVARKHFPNAFDDNIGSGVTNISNQPESIKEFHTPLAEDLESPLNILIPAYETMWRVVLYAFMEIKVRPLLIEDVSERINFEELDNSVKVFLEKPNNHTLKKEASPLWNVVQETLRLYPPTRHIHRVKDVKITIDVENIQRNPKIWGEDAFIFKPKRFNNKKPNEAYIPFSHGKFKCIAADNFAPTLAAILISTIMDRVDTVGLTKKSKEILLQTKMHPFENNRRAFDNLKIILTKKSL